MSPKGWRFTGKQKETVVPCCLFEHTRVLLVFVVPGKPTGETVAPIMVEPKFHGLWTLRCLRCNVAEAALEITFWDGVPPEK